MVRKGTQIKSITDTPDDTPREDLHRKCCYLRQNWHRSMFTAKHKDIPRLVGFKGLIKVALVVQYTSISGIWIAHSAWMLNNSERFFRNATKGFQFPSPEFSGMINWKLFTQSPWNVTLDQGTKITHVNGLHWGVRLSYKQAETACSQAEAQPSLFGGPQSATQWQPLLYKKSHMGKIILEICEKDKGKKQ